MLLSYHENLSFFAVGKRLRVHHQTVERSVGASCPVRRAPRKPGLAYGAAHQPPFRRERKRRRPVKGKLGGP